MRRQIVYVLPQILILLFSNPEQSTEQQRKNSTTSLPIVLLTLRHCSRTAHYRLSIYKAQVGQTLPLQRCSLRIQLRGLRDPNCSKDAFGFPVSPMLSPYLMFQQRLTDKQKCCTYYIDICGFDIDPYDKYFSKTLMKESLHQRSRVEEMSHGGPSPIGIPPIHYIVDWPETNPITGPEATHDVKFAVPFSELTCCSMMISIFVDDFTVA